MRVWFSGPRVLGIRPGISLGRSDLPALDRGIRLLFRWTILGVTFAVAALMATGHWPDGWPR